MTISILFAFQNRPAYQSLITENGFAECTYPLFQNSQEFALGGGVSFDILANSNEFHADGVFISAL